MVPELKSQSSRIFFISIILICLSAFFFRESITLFPSFIHAWTQSDRYALALGFLNNGLDFFHPQTFNLRTADGITRVDFPIHEYLVALIMKITGNHEPVVFRTYTLAYALAGLLFLYRLSRLFNPAFLWNLFVVLFLFLCPIFLYYADGFIPSITSLSNLFIGYFYYFRYRKEKRISDFQMALFFLTLAALARQPFLIFLFAVLCQQSLSYYSEKKIQWKEVLSVAFAIAAIIVYQLYSSYLGRKYGTQFLISLLPAKNFQQVMEWMKETWTNWKFDYLTRAHYLILGVLTIVFLFQTIRKKAATAAYKDLIIQLGIITTGSVIYYFLMLKQFPDHDYYFIDTFYPVIALLIILLTGFQRITVFVNYLIGVILSGLLFLSGKEAIATLERRYETVAWDRVEITRKNFTGTAQFLDSLGIEKQAKVLVLDGYTTNIPLIMMNRKGWTVNWTTKENIREGMLTPFDLVAIQNCFSASEVVKNDLSLIAELEKFADNGMVSFYRKTSNPNQNLEQFFGIDSSNTLFIRTLQDSIFIDSNSEFIELYSDSASKFNSTRATKILIQGKILCTQDAAPHLIASVSEGENSWYYFNFDLRNYTVHSPGWQTMLFQFVIPPGPYASGAVKVYLWNNHKSGFSYSGLRLIFYR